MNRTDEILRRALDPVPEIWTPKPGFRQAAVLVPIQRRDAADTILLIRRTDSMPSHAGQIAFPGGSREGDESPLECALRESHEELGLDPADVVVLGGLPSRVSNAGFHVHVIVGRIGTDFVPIPDTREVASIAHPEIEHLADRARWDWRDVPRVSRPMPHYELETGTLWGLTARFVFDLLERTHWSE
ncbi:MAG: CoA pyrophosphatase [Planctomycetes bacterium]|nr:CoA pyrophosphatase [Planctomycetota bacterium]